MKLRMGSSLIELSNVYKRFATNRWAVFGVPLEEHVPNHTTKEGLLIIGDFFKLLEKQF